MNQDIINKKDLVLARPDNEVTETSEELRYTVPVFIWLKQKVQDHLCGIRGFGGELLCSISGVGSFNTEDERHQQWL